MKKLIRYFLIVTALCADNDLFAQAPSLNYTTSSYTLHIAQVANIAAPNNTGGAVPATTYGTVSRFAGRSDGTTGTTDGTITSTTAVRFNGPAGLDITSSGLMFIADKTNNRIRRISGTTSTTSAGTTSTYAEGPAPAPRFAAPQDITDDGAGNYYIADFGNNRVRKMTMSGTTGSTTLVAGQTTAGTADGSGASAQFNGPASIVYDPVTTALFVVDQTSGRIRKVTTAGVVTTFVSSGLSSPSGIATDGAGNFYLADRGNHRIKRITAAGVVSVFAGSGTASSVDGTGIAATFNAPSGVAVDGSGNVYVTEMSGHKVRMITPAGVVTTVAGSGTASRVDAVGIAATFNTPYDVNVNPVNGHIYIADFANNSIRQIIGTGYTIRPALPAGLSFNVTTGVISGTPTTVTAPTVYTVTGFNASGSSSVQITIETDYTDPEISYATPQVYPASLAISSLTATNTGSTVITTFGYSNTPTQPLTGGTLNGPARGAADASGNIYIASFNGNYISKYSPTGTLINNNYGTGAPALVNPAGIVFDSNGNMYVLNAGAGVGTIYKYNSAGTYQATFSVAPGYTLWGLCIDAADNLYSAGSNGSVYGAVRITTAGAVTVLFTTTSTIIPYDVGIDAAGALYILFSNGQILKYPLPSTTGTLFTTISAGSFGLQVDLANGYVYASDMFSSPSPKIFAYNISSGTAIATITGVSDCRGLILDGRGGIYAPDYTNNIIYKYSPTGTFFLSRPLPSGLSLSKPNGTISGSTSANPSPATDYVVTGWNTAGGGSATINITVYRTRIWTSTSSTDWSLNTNWSGNIVPLPGDRVTIGQTNGLAVPTIGPGTTVNVSLLSLVNTGTTAPSVSVGAGSTLEVTGDITFTNTKNTNVTANITGAGTVNAKNLTVTNSIAGTSYALILNSSISNLNISGDLSLVSGYFTGPVRYVDADFTISGTGSVTVKNIKTTNANAGNTPVITVSNNTTLNFTGATPLSGLSATGTNTFTIGTTNTTIGYTGENDQEVYTNLAIPRSNLTSGISYVNIAFGGSGIKTPTGTASNNLNVSGNFTNSLVSNTTNTYVDLSLPTLVFNGAAAQALAGGTGAGTTFHKVNFSGNSTKTLSSGKFNLDVDGVLTMVGSSASTILAAGTGLLTLNSNANGSGTVAAITASGPSITGTVNVQRYVTGDNDLTNRGYRLFSSPIADASSPSFGNYNLSYLIGSGTYVTGAASGGFDATGNPTIYLYREDLAPNNASFASGNYRAITKVNNGTPYNIGTVDGNKDLPVGTGMMFFYRGNAGTNPTTSPASLVLTSTGRLNQGQVTVKNWVTGTAGLSYNAATLGNPRYNIQGFNLVGNPYPSSIDWNKVSNSNSANSIYAPGTDLNMYIYNASTKNYDTYSADGLGGGASQNGLNSVIPQGQGFFVRANAASPQLIFKETAKITDQPDVLLLNSAAARKQSILRLQLAKDAINKDETVFVFDNTKSSGYVESEDAPYFKGTGVVSLSNIASNNVALAISRLPFPVVSQSIPLNVAVSAAGTYQLNLKEASNIPAVYDIWLMDKFKNDSLDLKNNATYTFNTTGDTASYGANRFKIVMRLNANNAVRLLSFTGVKDNNKVKLSWTVENEGESTTYVLQRSTDVGVTYQTLDSLTSIGLGTYNDIDPNPVVGINKYRLKQTDVLGNITYSEAVTINFTTPGTPTTGNVMVYPNPVRYILAAAIKPLNNKQASYNITITNNMGIVIKKATTNLPIWLQDVSGLLPGTYFINVTNKADDTFVGRTSFIKL